MDQHFTKEGLQLAILKMTIENNALLHSMMHVLSRIYLDMERAPAPESLKDELEVLRAQFEDNAKRMAKVLESVSLEQAAGFAAEHDTNLDVHTFNFT